MIGLGVRMDIGYEGWINMDTGGGYMEGYMGGGVKMEWLGMNVGDLEDKSGGVGRHISEGMLESVEE